VVIPRAPSPHPRHKHAALGCEPVPRRREIHNLAIKPEVDGEKPPLPEKNALNACDRPSSRRACSSPGRFVQSQGTAPGHRCAVVGKCHRAPVGWRLHSDCVGDRLAHQSGVGGRRQRRGGGCRNRWARGERPCLPARRFDEALVLSAVVEIAARHARGRRQAGNPVQHVAVGGGIRAGCQHPFAFHQGVDEGLVVFPVCSSSQRQCTNRSTARDGADDVCVRVRRLGRG